MSDDYFSYQAKKFKPKLSYPDSRMRVYTKPEPKPVVRDVEVEETKIPDDATDTAIERILKPWNAPG